MDQIDFGDDIDRETFGQIVEMDEPGDNEFSRNIIYDFFNNASNTFEQMDEAL